jgi:hypothetical protein
MKLLAVAILILLSFSCTKAPSTLEVKGTLTGPDMALCPCCGGIVLTVDNVSGNFRIDSLPFMSMQALYNLDFPKRIEFDYSRKDTCGGIVRFTVTSYFISNN